MSDIGARFVACRRWRWMVGMRATGINGNNRKCSGVVTEIVNGRPNVVTSAGDDVLLIGAEPDTSAPSTLGCILALVRRAWGRPTMHLTRFHANVRDDSGAFTVPAVWWRFVDGDEPEPILVETEDRRRYLAGATEAEAMRCALELAP